MDRYSAQRIESLPHELLLNLKKYTKYRLQKNPLENEAASVHYHVERELQKRSPSPKPSETDG